MLLCMELQFHLRLGGIVLLTLVLADRRNTVLVQMLTKLDLMLTKLDLSQVFVWQTGIVVGLVVAVSVEPALLGRQLSVGLSPLT